MKKLLYILSYVCCFGGYQAQQDGLYTNFLLHQAVYNPAFIGSIEGKQFNIGVRNQWAGFEGAPKSGVASGYGNFRKKQNVAVGGILTSEKIGLIEFTSGYGIGSYRLKINKKSALSFGLSGGAIQYSAKTYNARTYDKDDAFVTSGLLSSLSFDANAGLYYYSKNLFVGLSALHMTYSKIRWNNSMGRITPHYYGYTGYNIYVDKKKEWCFQPSFLLRASPPAPYQMEFNLRCSYKDVVWITGNYRDKASVGLAAGCLISKQFMVAYAFDHVISELNQYVGATQEITLSYQIPLSKKKSKSEQIQDADEQELNTIDNTIKTTIKGKKEEENVPKQEPEKQDKPKK